MDINFYFLMFLMGIIFFLASWIKTETHRELQLIIAIMGWILLIASALMAYNIERTVYDGSDWNTTVTAEYVFVYISFTFAVIQTLYVIILILEYARIGQLGDERRKPTH